MSVSRATLERVARTVGYAALGVVLMAALSLGVLYAAQSLQPLVYDLLYLRLGPSTATEAATLSHFLTAGLLALAATALSGAALARRQVDRAVVAGGLLAVAGLLAGFLALSFAGVDPTLAALVVLAVAVIGLPAALWFRVGGRAGSLPAFAGSLPVLALLMVLAAFGLGWGGGYVLTATEVPSDTEAVADFAEVPQVSEDVFASGNCERNATGARECYLLLRGYEHDVAAARYLSAHGVQCPYRNVQPSEPAGSFVVRHDGTNYRVTCAAYGD